MWCIQAFRIKILPLASSSLVSFGIPSSRPLSFSLTFAFAFSGFPLTIPDTHLFQLPGCVIWVHSGQALRGFFGMSCLQLWNMFPITSTLAGVCSGIMSWSSQATFCNCLLSPFYHSVNHSRISLLHELLHISRRCGMSTRLCLVSRSRLGLSDNVCHTSRLCRKTDGKRWSCVSSRSGCRRC